MADTTEPQKYYFDLHIFDEPETDQQEEEAEPPPPTYSQEELDEARRQGHAEGKQEGRDEAYSELQAQMNTTLEALGGRLEELQAREQAREQTYEREAVELVRNLLDTLFPGLAEHYGRDEMLTFIHETVTRNGDEAKIRIDVSQQEHEQLKDHIQGFAPEGLLDVRASDTISPGDCRIEWKDGGAVRDQSAQLEAIRTHFDAILAENGENGHNATEDQEATSENESNALNREDDSHE